MKQEKLEYLQKKYESRLNPSPDQIEMAAGPGGPKGPGPGPGRGRGGRGGMPVKKPKNVKKTMGRLFA